jgi:hypothetical protein
MGTGDISMNATNIPDNSFSNGIYINGPPSIVGSITSMIFSIYKSTSGCLGSIRYGNTAIYLDQNGHVGINNNNPTAELDISGNLNCSGSGNITTPDITINDTTIATTAFVKNQEYAKIASPAFTGEPTAPNPSISDNSQKIATTSYLRTCIVSGKGPINSGASTYTFSYTTEFPNIPVLSFSYTSTPIAIYSLLVTSNLTTGFTITAYLNTGGEKTDTNVLGILWTAIGS